MANSTPNRLPRKRVLIVNCYFDDSHRPLRRTLKVPQAMGPAHLAGALSRELCDVRLYSELAGGPLLDRRLLGWPDMLVLTGLTNSLDRMLHLTAYARTLNPAVIVVAGGPAVRALPHVSERFLDYSCRGDVEQLREVIAEALGPSYVSDDTIPRFDLAGWMGRGIGYIETSRNCNFHCAFCSLAGEGNGYWKYDLENIRRQIVALGRKKFLQLIDNNFYGNDRDFFLARLDLLREMRDAGYYRGWGALVTNDFFLKDENLRLAREAGCVALFSGVESFDNRWLRSFNKLQNTRAPQVEMIRKCLDAGIAFLYGMIMDLSSRSVDDLRGEIEFITGTPQIPLPAFLTNVIPLAGTPFFNERLAAGDFLPLTKLRDLDGTTISLRPYDSLDRAVEFLGDLRTLRGYRARVARHSLAFWRNYRTALTKEQMFFSLGNAALLSAASGVTAPNPSAWFGRAAPRTFVTTTEPLDAVYTPAFRLPSRFQSYFKPTLVTDDSGEPTDYFAVLLEKNEPELVEATAA
jgi:hopanoid C-2 methylase